MNISSDAMEMALYGHASLLRTVPEGGIRRQPSLTQFFSQRASLRASHRLRSRFDRRPESMAQRRPRYSQAQPVIVVYPEASPGPRRAMSTYYPPNPVMLYTGQPREGQAATRYRRDILPERQSLARSQSTSHNVYRRMTAGHIAPPPHFPHSQFLVPLQAGKIRSAGQIVAAGKRSLSNFGRAVRDKCTDPGNNFLPRRGYSTSSNERSLKRQRLERGNSLQNLKPTIMGPQIVYNPKMPAPARPTHLVFATDQRDSHQIVVPTAYKEQHLQQHQQHEDLHRPFEQRQEQNSFPYNPPEIPLPEVTLGRPEHTPRRKIAVANLQVSRPENFPAITSSGELSRKGSRKVSWHPHLETGQSVSHVVSQGIASAQGGLDRWAKGSVGRAETGCKPQITTIEYSRSGSPKQRPFQRKGTDTQFETGVFGQTLALPATARSISMQQYFTPPVKDTASQSERNNLSGRFMTLKQTAKSRSISVKQRLLRTHSTRLGRSLTTSFRKPKINLKASLSMRKTQSDKTKPLTGILTGKSHSHATRRHTDVRIGRLARETADASEILGQSELTEFTAGTPMRVAAPRGAKHATRIGSLANTGSHGSHVYFSPTAEISEFDASKRPTGGTEDRGPDHRVRLTPRLVMSSVPDEDPPESIENRFIQVDLPVGSESTSLQPSKHGYRKVSSLSEGRELDLETSLAERDDSSQSLALLSPESAGRSYSRRNTMALSTHSDHGPISRLNIPRSGSIMGETWSSAGVQSRRSTSAAVGMLGSGRRGSTSSFGRPSSSERRYTVATLRNMSSSASNEALGFLSAAAPAPSPTPHCVSTSDSSKQQNEMRARLIATAPAYRMPRSSGMLLFYLSSAIGNLQPRFDDDFVDQLNHYYTTMLLVVFAMIVSAKQYVGQAIQCWVPATFTDPMEQYTENFCWVHTTYWLPFTIQVKLPKHQTESGEVVSYYQWVPFVLAIQALLFFLPCLFWRCLTACNTSINIEKTIELAHTCQMMDRESREETLDLICSYIEDHLRIYYKKRLAMYASVGRQTAEVRQRHSRARCCFRILPKLRLLRWRMSHCGFTLTLVYVISKLLYFLNIVVQFFILDRFLGTRDFLYGYRIVSQLFRANEWEHSGRFPRVTLCDFHVRVLGNVHRHTVQCVIMINMFNEKIFIFLWFWFATIGVVTFLNCLYWIFTMICPESNVCFIRKHVSVTLPYAELVARRYSPSSSMTKPNTADDNNNDNNSNQETVTENTAGASHINIGNTIDADVTSDNNNNDNNNNGNGKPHKKTTPRKMSQLHSKILLTKFVNDYLRVDGVFLLRMISTHAGELVTSEIVIALWESFNRTFNNDSSRKTKIHTVDSDDTKNIV